MSRLPALPAEAIVAGPPPERPPRGRTIGRSRHGREIVAHRLGQGPLSVSLIAGCHADEPVGPEMLRRLVAHLAELPADDPLLAGATWSIVPHVHPDGEAANAGWSRATLPTRDHLGRPDRAHDPARYVAEVVRDPPGDDLEFGFPRGPDDAGARPESRAVAAFLAEAAPFHLHATLHGMGFADGPWFLLEAAWEERTVALRDALRRRVREMGYRLFDVDRGGEKGFRRIDEGFSTRPDSRAMRRHFLDRGDPETAALFRPSSMEHVRSLGGDPLTFVSEMPLFLLPAEPGPDGPPRGTGSEGRLALHRWLRERVDGKRGEEALAAVERAGVRGMPVGDQMRLQVELLRRGLEAVGGTTDDG